MFPYNKINIAVPNWREVLTGLGIQVIQSKSQFLEVMLEPNTILVTKCTMNKNQIEQGTPKELYIDYGKGDFERMVKFAEKESYFYGVLSGKGKGILFEDTIIPYYDQNPNKYTDEEYMEINSLIESKCKERGIKNIVIYGRSIALAVRVIRWTSTVKDIKIYYTTRLYSTNPLFLF